MQSSVEGRKKEWFARFDVEQEDAILFEEVNDMTNRWWMRRKKKCGMDKIS